MAKRASLSRVKRLAIFEAHGGICHLCQRKVQAGEAWEVSHDRPLELLGADDDENRKPAHKSCHAVQTREHDIPRIAKAKRQKMAALGIRKPSKFRKPPAGVRYEQGPHGLRAVRGDAR